MSLARKQNFFWSDGEMRFLRHIYGVTGFIVNILFDSVDYLFC